MKFWRRFVMAKKKIVEENRIVDEMLEMAQALQGHA